MMIVREKNMEIKFTCKLPPSVNTYLGKSVVWIAGRPTVHIYETAKAKAYKKYLNKIVKEAMKEYQWEKTQDGEYVICEMEVYLSRKRSDSDNILKCLLDGITTSEAIFDDSFIIPRFKNVYIDANDPRVEVTLVKINKKGIFAGDVSYKYFLNSYCKKCSRYSRNCSILKKALDNKITKELDKDSLTCSAYKEKK